MVAHAPLLRGPLASHPLAAPFAAEVFRIHRRYAAEAVAAYRLCPHLHDIDTGMGTLVIVLDAASNPSLDVVVDAVSSSAAPVLHVVFPLLQVAPTIFERFAARIGPALRKAMPDPPVMATFHPELTGDASDPHRLIGIFRRAPDPFVQFIPAGLQEGGTIFMPLPKRGEQLPPALLASSVSDWPQQNFHKMKHGGLDRWLAVLADIRADRDQRYAPFVRAFAPQLPEAS